MEGEPLFGIRCAVSGEVFDFREPIGDGADRHVESQRGFGRDISRVEVGVQGVDQQIGTTSNFVQPAQHIFNEIDDRRLVAAQHAVDE